MFNKTMTNADIKTVLSRQYSNSRRKSYQERLYDYNSGKKFIEMHMESYNDYDELVKFLIDLLRI